MKPDKATLKLNDPDLKIDQRIEPEIKKFDEFLITNFLSTNRQEKLETHGLDPEGEEKQAEDLFFEDIKNLRR